MTMSMDAQKRLETIVPSENVKYQEPMKNHTTFRVGGEASCIVFAESANQIHDLFSFCKEENIPYMVMGNGSNLLFADEGYGGMIIVIGNKMQEIRCEGNRITAKAGALMSKIAAVAKDYSLTGMEFASGIPGTIGGGVVMNAGAYGGELAQIITTVTVLDENGEEQRIPVEDMEFGYRTSLIKKKPLTVVEVEILLQPGNQEEIKAKMDELAAKRKEKQPLEYPSAGSTFKRPEGHFAGELIMNAGLRGFQIGGARVSDKHCGFVINAGGATCRDICELMEHVQKKVKEMYNVELEPEVILIPGGK